MRGGCGGGRCRRSRGWSPRVPKSCAACCAAGAVVVALVEVLQHRREDFGLLLRERDPLALRLEELAAAEHLEEGALAQHVLVGREQPPFPAHRERHDGRGARGFLAGSRRRLAAGLLDADERPLQFRQLLGIPHRAGRAGASSACSASASAVPLGQPGRLVHAVLRVLHRLRRGGGVGPERALEHGVVGGVLGLVVARLDRPLLRPRLPAAASSGRWGGVRARGSDGPTSETAGGGLLWRRRRRDDRSAGSRRAGRKVDKNERKGRKPVVSGVCGALGEEQRATKRARKQGRGPMEKDGNEESV